jgi:phosphoglycerate kinase
MTYKSVKDIDVKGKTVLLRADLNVPVQDGNITDTTRIDRVKPTIDQLVEGGAKILVLSHFGRPKGERNMDYSLSFLPQILEKKWGHKVKFAEDCIGEPAKTLAGELAEGEIGLLENVRFHKGEEKNDPEFIRQLAEIGDVFVNDAFSAAHRAHASTEGIAHMMPTAAGMLMEMEIEALTKALENPVKPVAAVVGGAKISTKLSVLNNLVQKVDYMILGGGMANTFMYAGGQEVGKSLCEKDMAEEARKIMQTAEKTGCRIVLPRDRVIVEELKEGADFEITASDMMPADKEAIDAGPETVSEIGKILEGCKTVLWNGPLGVFEIKPFDKGTNEVARKVADLTRKGEILSVAGGGDTVSALENAGVADNFSYVSTAGGAFLEWMEGKSLPGVAALGAYKDAA